MLLRLPCTVKLDLVAMVDDRYVLESRSGKEPDGIMQPAKAADDAFALQEIKGSGR
jgi:hypothetical protein